ncbi:MFS transporter [Micropruina sp.]|uniref:MFS transporter n=1 Tax=Micropruina sp. TaxID=2737536 RepID=UPI0039E4192B
MLLAAAALTRLCPGVPDSLLTGFVASHATTTLHLPTSTVPTAVMIGSGGQVVVMPLAGTLTEKFDRRLVSGIATVPTAIWVPVLFVLIQDASPSMLATSIVVGMILHALMYGPQAASIAEQLPARLRYVGSSPASTLTGVVGGAVAPLLCTLRCAKTQWWISIAAYVRVAAAATLIGMLIGRDPHDKENLELFEAGTRAAQV